jgi:fused signal recognition particle receptor
LAIRSASGIRESLGRTRRAFFGEITSLLGRSEIDAAFWEELEELLVMADVGVTTATSLIEGVRGEARGRGLVHAAQVSELLRERMVEVFAAHARSPIQTEGRPLTVILVVGVNGSGKTTSIAKLTHYYQRRGKKVLLAAADTFRAAAIEQLQIWAGRTGTQVIAHQPGSDPGAVVYDAVRASESRGMDLLIIDTAGRLHTKYNLMEELGKIRRVAAKVMKGAPHETLLVLDATTGQNALVQARHFQQAVDVTGVMLTKLDGTAKGGIVFAIAQELGLPILFVTTGEGMEELAEFDAQEFVEGLFT